MELRLPAVFCASEENDLVSALRQSGYAPELAATSDEAVKRASFGEAVLILADDYPAKGTSLSAELLARAREKRLRLYVEYPESVLGEPTGEARTIVFERLIAPDGFFGAMAPGSILMLNGCWHRPWFTKGPGLLCLAKVAGYDEMAYGLPEDVYTILDYLDEREDALVATSRLSSFIRGRYAPACRWRALWQALLARLGCEGVALKWQPDVGIAADADTPLPADAAERAWRRNIDWARRYMIGRTSPIVSVFEGYESAIDYAGRQFLRTTFRSDCMGETAMALGYGWARTGDPELKKICGEIIDRVLTPGPFYHDDPESAMYGLNNWFENGQIFYGDDNARMLMGALSARELLGDERWDERILRCVLANLRTSDKNGLRRFALRAASFEGKSWTDFYNEETDYIASHYQAYLWAIFIWVYALTGIDELLTKSERAIALLMARFPDKLKWQNSLTGEIARMLLPLSFLVRVRPTEEHRAWLARAIDALLEYQQPCGAIIDAFGDLSLGKYPPPQSNERYGTSEASLIQQNGDPATDLLYTTNWAFIGLYEASLALDDARVRAAYDKLKDFILRIQVSSEKYPELDGAWMRSFDFKKWEYWGSAADIGWSAWSVESGWVNAWIATTLMLDERGESLMKLSSRQVFAEIAPNMYREMLTPRPTREAAKGGSASMPGSAE